MAGNANSGRDRKFKQPMDLQRAVDAYFDDCKKNDKRPMLTALYNFLGCWHGYFQELTAEKPIFSKVVKRTIARMAEEYETRTDNRTTIPALGIFMLKNCGYTDRVEVNASITDNSSLGDLAKAVRDKRAKQGKH
jgi:hypothetical protein